MKVTTNICARPGLSPSVSLAFRRSSGSCKPDFFSSRSSVLLKVAEHLHVHVCCWSKSAFGQLRWKGRCLCEKCLFVAVGYCTADGVLYAGSRTAEMIVLGTRVVFHLINGQRPCTREQVLLTAWASLAKQATHKPYGNC